MAVVIVVPTAAHAAYDAPISGNTGSNSMVYYLSANFRTLSVDMGGYVQINIDRTPRFSDGTTPDHLKWRIKRNSDGAYRGPWALNQDPAAWVSLGFIDYPHQMFRNAFTRGHDCPNCDHDFWGNMNY